MVLFAWERAEMECERCHRKDLPDWVLSAGLVFFAAFVIIGASMDYNMLVVIPLGLLALGILMAGFRGEERKKMNPKLQKIPGGKEELLCVKCREEIEGKKNQETLEAFEDYHKKAIEMIDEHPVLGKVMQIDDVKTVSAQVMHERIWEIHSALRGVIQNPAVTERLWTEENRLSWNRIWKDYNQRYALVADLSNGLNAILEALEIAKGFERARNFESAARIYEALELWDEAGRTRQK